MNHIAHLKESSPFHHLFECGKCPIQNIQPEHGSMGQEGVHEFYRVDVARISQAQFKQLAALVAEQCQGRPEDVEAFMCGQGFIPLRALHVRCVTGGVSLKAFV